jgi:hypothetical protein
MIADGKLTCRSRLLCTRVFLPLDTALVTAVTIYTAPVR